MNDTNFNFRLPSAKEVLVLEMLLGTQKMYGLEMVKQKPKDLKRGTIYVTLNRMEDRGLIVSEKEDNPNIAGLARRLYRITGYGQQSYKAWQRAEAEFGNGLQGGLVNA